MSVKFLADDLIESFEISFGYMVWYVKDLQYCDSFSYAWNCPIIPVRVSTACPKKQYRSNFLSPLRWWEHSIFLCYSVSLPCVNLHSFSWVSSSHVSSRYNIQIALHLSPITFSGRNEPLSKI
jgi:hypothetical protein